VCFFGKGREGAFGKDGQLRQLLDSCIHMQYALISLRFLLLIMFSTLRAYMREKCAL